MNAKITIVGSTPVAEMDGVTVIGRIPTVKQLPWYLRGMDGFPIEFRKNEGRISRAVRIAFQNIRKITG